MDARKPREYYGVLIHPMSTNPMGCRWWAFGSGRMLQADTLNGIKSLIRKDLGKVTSSERGSA